MVDVVYYQKIWNVLIFKYYIVILILDHQSQPALDVRDLQGTFRGLLGDQPKNRWFDGKKCFLDAMIFVLHIYDCFLLEKQLFKSSKYGRPQDVYGTQLRDVPGTKWWDVLGKSRAVGHACFLNSTQKHIKIPLASYSRLYSELW